MAHGSADAAGLGRGSQPVDQVHDAGAASFAGEPAGVHGDKDASSTSDASRFPAGPPLPYLSAFQHLPHSLPPDQATLERTAPPGWRMHTRLAKGACDLSYVAVDASASAARSRGLQ